MINIDVVREMIEEAFGLDFRCIYIGEDKDFFKYLVVCIDGVMDIDEVSDDLLALQDQRALGDNIDVEIGRIGFSELRKYGVNANEDTVIKIGVPKRGNKFMN